MKKIIYKDEQEAIIREIELPFDEYYSEPNDIKGKYKTREIYKNEKLNEYTIFYKGNKNRIEILTYLNLQDIKIAIGQREYIGEFRHEKLYHYNSNKILEKITVIEEEDIKILVGKELEIFEENEKKKLIEYNKEKNKSLDKELRERRKKYKK